MFSGRIRGCAVILTARDTAEVNIMTKALNDPNKTLVEVGDELRRHRLAMAQKRTESSIDLDGDAAGAGPEDIPIYITAHPQER